MSSTASEPVLTSVLRHPSLCPSHPSHGGPGALGRAGRRDTVTRGQKTLVLKSGEDEEFPAILSLSLGESSTALGLFFDLLQYLLMGRVARARNTGMLTPFCLPQTQPCPTQPSKDASSVVWNRPSHCVTQISLRLPAILLPQPSNAGIPDWSHQGPAQLQPFCSLPGLAHLVIPTPPTSPLMLL